MQNQCYQRVDNESILMEVDVCGRVDPRGDGRRGRVTTSVGKPRGLSRGDKAHWAAKIEEDEGLVTRAHSHSDF